jgi:hypothetical protein
VYLRVVNETLALRCLLASIVMLVACESGASLGTACTRASECASPLVCRLGRCRTECAAARDCPAGQVCLAVAAGQGACELPAIDVCAMSCDAPLVCASGHCRVECMTDGDCPEGHGCASGVCQRSDSTMDAGAIDAAASDAAPSDAGPRDAPRLDTGRGDSGFACDPIDETGCTGERCGLVGGVPTCVASGGVGVVGTACRNEVECASGLSCQGGLCVRVCLVGDDGFCGDDLVCSRDGVAHQSFLDSEQPLGLCTEACDPVADTGCPIDATCAIGSASGDRWYTWCRVFTDVIEGRGCMNAIDCGAGLDCYGGSCRNFCHAGVDADCTGGFHCDGSTTFAGGNDVGACTPP